MSWHGPTNVPPNTCDPVKPSEKLNTYGRNRSVPRTGSSERIVVAEARGTNTTAHGVLAYLPATAAARVAVDDRWVRRRPVPRRPADPADREPLPGDAARRRRDARRWAV